MLDAVVADAVSGGTAAVVEGSGSVLGIVSEKKTLREVQESIAYGEGSKRLSAFKLRLPNCIPTLSTGPNELGKTTG